MNLLPSNYQPCILKVGRVGDGLQHSYAKFHLQSPLRYQSSSRATTGARTSGINSNNCLLDE